MKRGALRLLNRGEFQQILNLVLPSALHRVLGLGEHLEEDGCSSDVLTRAKLSGELHAGVVDDVAVDPASPAAGSSRGLSLL